MSDRIFGFDWDEANLHHCQKHGVSRPEVESLFARPIVVLPDVGHSDVERRLKAVGRTKDGRSVFVVFTIRTQDSRRYLRPISARYMHAKEIERFEKENPHLRD